MTYPGIFVMGAFVILAAAALTANADSASFMVKSGKAVAIIVIPDDATSGEKYAAQELRDHIRKITGAELSLSSEKLYSRENGPFISIGRTDLSRKYVSDEQLKTMGDDGYHIFCKDGNAFFIGGRRRGAIYAVYEYLESLGVRWYSPDYTVIPRLSNAPMPSHLIEYTPKLWYRCQWWNNGFTVEWLARARVNGNIGQFPEIPESMGGCIKAMHSCHSYSTLVPADPNFAQHPEWFAIKEDGKRSPHELCLTNPDLRDFMTSRVLSDLKNCSGKVENFWVSQNDGGMSACFCEKCTAERIAHGGKDKWSANTISFVSDVAERVKKEYPGVRIKTLAYNYTKEPPENMKASDTVLVEICGNFGPKNDDHEKIVKKWSAIAKNISVYTYGGSNYGYFWPFPNLYELGMQAPWALQNGVTAFYVQGTALGKGSGLIDLRAWLTARMMWDPSRDVKREIRDFCDGFYGPAGKYIVEYHDWYADYIKRNNLELYTGWGDGEAWRVWVTKDAMDRAEDIFHNALEAVKRDPVYLRHVRRAYLEVLWGEIMLTLKPGTENKAEFLPGTDVPAIREKANLFGEIMRENGYDHLAEWLIYKRGENQIDAAAQE
ncbi:DUF4838 domain-containing protein [Candidatus Sumerlaeota bacterium]|nr:DUF4838 domain-containing protein [Candidatus Sumerlaeota bacterium]